MESKICTKCKIRKHINKFYKKYTEFNDCNSKRSLKRCYENKDKISNQQKIYYGKKEINYYRKQND